MNNNFDAGTAAILSALLTGCISIIATFFANRHAARQQQAQWAREELRAQKEREEAEKNKEATVWSTVLVIKVQTPFGV